MPKKTKDLTGQRFGALTAMELVPNNKRAAWRCKCDCGQEKIVLAQNLIGGLTTSCGCHMHKMAATTGMPWSPGGKLSQTKVSVKLDPATDGDIIDKLESVQTKQGYIKRLIREDIMRKRHIATDTKT